MNYKNYLSSVSNVYRNNSLLKVGFIVLLLMQIGTWQQQKSYLDSQKIVLTPIGHANNMWVSNNDASDEYLLFMTDYALGLLGNYNAHTVQEQFNKLVKLHSPEKAGEAKRKLDGLAVAIKKYVTAGSQLNYKNEDIAIDREQHVIKVKAHNERYLNGVRSGTSNKTYYLFYTIEGGRFWLQDIKEGKINA